MAIVHQQSFTSTRQDAGLFRELDALERLQKSLPDNFEIFHSINWFITRNSQDQHGEIDVVVMRPEGNLLLIEIKAGEVVLRNGEIFKIYPNSESNVSRQSKFQYSAIINRLTEMNLHPYVTNCLVLPDYTIEDANLVSFPKERIITAEDYDFLGTRVQEILSHGHGRANVDQIRAFLVNEFKVTPNLTVLKGQINSAIHQLSDGMSVWVPRISSPLGIFHIKATAGSGKTQLALKLMHDASQDKQKTLYVCFNRPLADHLSKIAPVSARVTTFHELCVDQLKRKSDQLDFQSSETFEKAVNEYIESASTKDPIYDLIIVDECQDFQPEWINTLLPQLQPEGRIYLMEDPDQCLYTRDNFDINDAVIITCNDNFRSPQSICQLINTFGLSSTPIKSASPFKGEFPNFLTYHDEKSLITQTEMAIDSLLEKGFLKEDIVVLTGRGRAKSYVLSNGRIGKYSLSTFTGEFSDDGEPVWSDGELMAESIYRFKGQSSPAVVMTEIDFEEMNETERNKLFVGLTRAQMAVEVVFSKHAENWFSQTLNAI